MTTLPIRMILNPLLDERLNTFDDSIITLDDRGTPIGPEIPTKRHKNIFAHEE